MMKEGENLNNRKITLEKEIEEVENGTDPTTG